MIEHLYVALLFISVIYLFAYFRRKIHVNQLLRELPGPKRDSVALGQTIEFSGIPRFKRLGYLGDISRVFGTIFRMYLGNKCLVFLADPDAAATVLSSHTNICKGIGYGFLKEWLGTGIMTADGDEWQNTRNSVWSVFHNLPLHTNLKVFLKNSEILVQKLSENLDLQKFDISPYIDRCSLDITCETLTGVEVNEQNSPSEHTMATQRIEQLIMHRILNPWMWLSVIYRFTNSYQEEQTLLKVLRRMSSKIINKRMENNNIPEDNGTKEPTNFLDALSNVKLPNIQLTNNELRHLIDVAIFGGYNSVSIATNWAIYLLGLHQDVQDKVLNELKQVLKPTNRIYSIDQLSKLEYLERVINESLRLFPPIPILGRTLAKDTVIRGYEIPAGTHVQIDVYNIHRHPVHYSKPRKFNPENFSAENTKHRHPFAFIPFSAGPRNCIGHKYALVQIKVILATLLLEYHIYSLDRQEDLLLTSELMLRSFNGISVRISKRRC